MPSQNQNDSLVLSYLGLRKAIGIIGLALPFVLVFGKIILSGPGIEGSISGYYYTIMRDVFVASLCAIGVFLMSYHGYGPIDDTAGDLAFLFAVTTAFFPTSPEFGATHTQIIIGWVHLTAASLLFLTLAFFALFLFRKTDPIKPMTPQKKKRNFIYTVSGVVMLACIILSIAVKFQPPTSTIFKLSPIFWLESTAIVAFGISWFVKGEAILKDE